MMLYKCICFASLSTQFFKMRIAGSNQTGDEYNEEITGRVMQGIKEFLAGGGGGAGMFSLTEWIMKGAVWIVGKAHNIVYIKKLNTSFTPQVHIRSITSFTLFLFRTSLRIFLHFHQSCTHKS
uniref:Uncharacterized protein n=1 Tax=Candidatus Methanogaster sp. ANME-2c ERB4 TaxID=2759911 RepID=A0A7G9YQH9_9EURY|nr:hypothetical protein MIKCHCCC_00003 [Methanosarcinales archaeon ANME-2c ERB4]